MVKTCLDLGTQSGMSLKYLQWAIKMNVIMFIFRSDVNGRRSMVMSLQCTHGFISLGSTTSFSVL